MRGAVEAAGATVVGRIRVARATGEWGEAWPEEFVPVAVGRRLLVAPPWIDRLPAGRVALVIEPGGFGTGHHATTAGCLAALEALLDREMPASALDLGTGSGILAIAAARLGVARVRAVDTDVDAIATARANAIRNGVAARVTCEVADAAALTGEPAPLVLANLLAPVHLALASRYAGLASPGGWLVLGGVEAHEAAGVRDAVERAGFRRRDERTHDDWTTLVLQRA